MSRFMFYICVCLVSVSDVHFFVRFYRYRCCYNLSFQFCAVLSCVTSFLFVLPPSVFSFSFVSFCVFTVRMNPIVSFELLFFAVFGQTTTEQTQVDKMGNQPKNQRGQPQETDYLFKVVFGIYMLVSVVVLINLLIAMMSDTYQRIQVFFHVLAYKKKKQNQFKQTSKNPIKSISS